LDISLTKNKEEIGLNIILGYFKKNRAILGFIP